MADSLFELHKVSFAYGNKKVLTDIGLSLPPGKFYGLLGPNGSGKTTLLDLLIANRAPAQGTIHFKGRQLTHFSRRQLAREFSLVPQDFIIGFDYTVLDVVLMGRHPYIPRFGSPSAADLTIAEQAMESIGIAGFAERYVTELSGGEKQRVVVARALAQQTPVLILDEATSNLDISHTLEIFQVVRRRVREQGHTVIGAIHDLNLAAAYCDEIVFLKEGGLFCQGPTKEVMNAENIAEVFGVESRVFLDEYSGAQQVSLHYG